MKKDSRRAVIVTDKQLQVIKDEPITHEVVDQTRTERLIEVLREVRGEE